MGTIRPNDMRKHITRFLLDCGAESLRIRETGRTLTFEVTMQRAKYEACVEPHIEPDATATDWTAELVELHKVGDNNPSVQTGGGTYTYTLLVLKH